MTKKKAKKKPTFGRDGLSPKIFEPTTPAVTVTQADASREPLKDGEESTEDKP